MITFYERFSNYWYAVVYPAGCTLSSAASDQIHLHSRAGRSMHVAVNGLQRQILDRIGECFRVSDGSEAPVVGECEAKCGCVRYTPVVAVVGQGREILQNSVLSVETELDRSDDAGTPSSTDTPRSPQVQAGPARDVSPIVPDMEATAQRTHLPPSENSPSAQGSGVGDMDQRVSQPSTIVQLIPPTGDTIPTVKSSDLSANPETIIEPGAADAFAPMSRSLRGEDLIVGAVVPSIVNQDDHIRHLIREEIGRVLGAAIASVPDIQMYPHVVIRDQIRHAFGAAMESLPPKET